MSKGRRVRFQADAESSQVRAFLERVEVIESAIGPSVQRVLTDPTGIIEAEVELRTLEDSLAWVGLLSEVEIEVLKDDADA